jgi:hypothetical protein
MHQRKVRIVDGTEIGMSREGGGDVERDGTQKDCDNKNANRDEQCSFHVLILNHRDFNSFLLAFIIPLRGA